MAMDKSWIREKNRFSLSYANGVKSFINFAKQNVKGSHNLIRCPCVICNNAYYKSTDEVGFDLHINGFSKTYVDWIYHGDTLPIIEENENEKGMGYGVEVTRGSNFLSSTQQGSELSEKLNETQTTLDNTQLKLNETKIALDSAQGKINTLSEQLEELKEKNKSHEDKLADLMSKFQEMQRTMLKMQGPTSNLS